jgi:hypothetical protein
VFDDPAEITDTHYRLAVLEISADLPADPELGRAAGPILLLKIGWELALTTAAPQQVGTVGEVTDELLDCADDLPQWLANGLEPLDRSARAAVAASVTAWALDAVAAVRSRPELIWDGRNQKVNLDPYAVTLSARWDARLGDVRSPTTLLVHSGRVADRDGDEVQAGFVALVACFRGRAVPERVRFSTAGTGQTRAVSITADVLDRAIDRVLELLGHAVAPESAEYVAGRWCSWCHLAADCAAGQRFLSS